MHVTTFGLVAPSRACTSVLSLQLLCAQHIQHKYV
jgi:hypothetical protein